MSFPVCLELRTPLTILNGYAQLAASAKDAPPALRDWIGRIKNAGGRLQLLVSQIVAMLEDGNFESQLHRTDVKIADLLTSIVDEVQPFVETRSQTLVREWSDDIGTMSIDGDKIRDSVHQLLLNAIKFTPDGGRITLSARRADMPGVEFTINDTGRGMDSASVKQCGQAFFTQFDVAHHASGTHEHERRGLGLGLALVQKFAEMHGGNMCVASEVGVGTTVTLFIPDANTLSPPQAAAAAM